MILVAETGEKLLFRLTEAEKKLMEINIILRSELGDENSEGNINRHIRELRQTLELSLGDKRIRILEDWMNFLKGCVAMIILILIPLAFQITAAWIQTMFH